jgi:hypothetical protein
MYDIELKYIMIDEKYPIIFTTSQTHDQFRNFRNITSAGFCQIWQDKKGIKVRAWGKSITLNINSKETDSETIKNQIISFCD